MASDVSALDYPVAAPRGVAPIIFRSQIIQTMALRYFAYMKGVEPPFTMAEAHDAAMATWGSDWPSDPEPRTLEAGIEAAEDDLAYWNEE